MWSVWPETAHLYLGPSVVMVQTRGKLAPVLEYEQPLAIERMLVGVSQALEEQRVLGTGRVLRLRVALSAAFSPAFTFLIPKQVTRWSERLEIARATAALTMDTAPDQLLCEMDTGQPGLASAVAVRTMTALRDWAARHRCVVSSMQPLWVNAAQSRSAAHSAVRGLILMEPDATTVLVNTGTRKIALTQPKQRESSDDQASVRRLLIGMGLNDKEVLRLVFVTNSGPAIQHGPTAWLGHWVSQ